LTIIENLQSKIENLIEPIIISNLKEQFLISQN